MPKIYMFDMIRSTLYITRKGIYILFHDIEVARKQHI